MPVAPERVQDRGVDCVLCRIVAGTAPADLVAETPRVVAFCDAAPITPGHLLVVPRRHGTGLAELSDDDAAAMTVLARRLAVALRAAGLRHSGRPAAPRRWRVRPVVGGDGGTGVPMTGTNLFLADGASAGQEVLHAHLHVIPRYGGDGVRLRTGPRHSVPDERAEVAQRVRAALGDR